MLPPAMQPISPLRDTGNGVVFHKYIRMRRVIYATENRKQNTLTTLHHLATHPERIVLLDLLQLALV
jgi:hypothetical protein